jgi:hypothetical protein
MPILEYDPHIPTGHITRILSSAQLMMWPNDAERHREYPPKYLRNSRD